MTENLAGRGEGLAGLVAKWREIGKKYLGPPLKLKSRDETMVMAGIETAAQAVYVLCADQLETALEAAAPPGTARQVTSDCLDQLREMLDRKDLSGADLYALNEAITALATPSPQAPQVVTDLQIALRIVGDWKEDSRGLVHVHKDVIRKAIVAALRSAGVEQCNAFSPTSAREQSSATASNEPSVGYSEDSPFSVNHAALAKTQVSANIVAPNPDCPLCFGTGSWVEGERCACTERPLR